MHGRRLRLSKALLCAIGKRFAFSAVPVLIENIVVEVARISGEEYHSLQIVKLGGQHDVVGVSHVVPITLASAPRTSNVWRTYEPVTRVARNIISARRVGFQRAARIASAAQLKGHALPQLQRVGIRTHGGVAGVGG